MNFDPTVANIIRLKDNQAFCPFCSRPMAFHSEKNSELSSYICNKCGRDFWAQIDFIDFYYKSDNDKLFIVYQYYDEPLFVIYSAGGRQLIRIEAFVIEDIGCFSLLKEKLETIFLFS